MSDHEKTIKKLRGEYWLLEADAPRPKPVAMIAHNIARREAIKIELKELGSDVGERPAEFPNRVV